MIHVIVWALPQLKLAIKRVKFEKEYSRMMDSHYSDLFNASVQEPAPKGEGTIIVDLVSNDLKIRAEVGKKKYGTYLRTENGRSALIDAYQEALDLCMYLRQRIEEERK